MEFSEYQKIALVQLVYPDIGKNFAFPLIGMCGEVGEVADKFKKVMRDSDSVIDDETRIALIYELGDVLWYLMLCAAELGCDLEFVAKRNLDKLASRIERNAINGTGDKR